MKGNALSRFLLSLLSLIVLAGWSPSVSAADKTVTVGTQTSVTTYVPVMTTWHDNWSEIIYTSDMLSSIPEGSVIKKIGFNGMSLVDIADMQYEVYIKATEATEAPASRSDLSGFTCLFNGTVSVAKSESTSTPEPLLTVGGENEFTYEGGNLHVVVKSHFSQLPEGSIYFSYQNKPKSVLQALSNDAWDNVRESNYQYLPVMNLEVGMPAGYVDLTKVSVGNGTSTDFSTPISLYYDKHSMSSTLYTSDMLGIPADMDIHQISYDGWIQTASTDPIRIRVWMANTTDTDVPAQVPALTAMIPVLDTQITLDQTQGSNYYYVELLKLMLDTPFRYTGGNLLIVIQADNTKNQRVNFCVDSDHSGMSIYGYGSSDDISGFSFYAGKFPKTNIYYAAPQVETAPEISFVTNKEAGASVTMSLVSRDGVRVDWGGKLKDYPYGGALTLSYDLSGNEVKIWPMSDDDHITSFSCRDAAISSISLKAPALTYLRLSDNLIETVDISDCPVLETLILKGNRIFDFNTSSPTIKTLDLSHNVLEKFRVAGFTALERLDISVNSLRYPVWIEWPEAPAMNYLNVSFNNLLQLDLAAYKDLKTLICNNNGISELDLRNVPALEVLRAGYNAYKTLDVAKCPGLKVLDISGTSTSPIRLGSLASLEELNMQLTGINSVNLSANTALRSIVLSQNALTALDLSANKAVEHLDIRKNEISSVDLSMLTKLRFLDCSSNALEALDLLSNVALDSLYCSINNLSELPLAAGNHIQFIDFASNSIASQPVNMTAVKYLNCADNKWTSVDLSRTPAILGLDIHSNLLDKDALLSMFSQLPDVNGIEVPENDASWMRVLNYNDNPGTAEVSSEIPETKGWNCSYKADILGDASAAILIPADKVYTRMSFGIDTKDEVYYVDWGDGKKEEFRTENPEYSYNSIVGYATGEIVRIYAPSTTELGVSNAGYLDLDVSGMPGLLRLSCSGNNLSSLDVSKNTVLQDLNCRKNPLTAISFPENCKLTSLDCSSTLIRAFDLSKVPDLIQLAVNSCRLESLDLTPVRSLQMLQADDNMLRSVDISGLSQLIYLYLSKNQLTSLDLSDNLYLKELAVDYNSIESLDLSMLKFVESAHVNKNQIKSISLDNPAMKTFLAGSNRLSEIDLSKLPAITTATVNDNELSSLDISGNEALIQFFAGDNKLESLTLASSMPGLKILNVDNNSLSDINLSALPALYEFVISHNKFSGTLDFSKNPNLYFLQASHNEIEGFKWGPTASVATIYASYNNIRTLNVPGNALSVIDLSRNSLEAVNLSKLDNLFYLVLDFNKLTSVNLKANQNLQGVSLRANMLGAAAIDQICEQLPDINDLGVVPGEEAWMKYLFLSGNPGCEDANVTPAVYKGWTVVRYEDIPVDRVLTLNVVASDGSPVVDATLVLVVNGQDAGTRPVETDPGVYVYDPLPVFLDGVTYSVRVEKDGYNTQLVDISDIVEGDMTLTVTLEAVGGGIEDANDDAFRVMGSHGCVKVYLPCEIDVVLCDITGRQVFTGTLPAGESVIDSLAPGIYIALGAKVRVF